MHVLDSNNNIEIWLNNSWGMICLTHFTVTPATKCPWLKANKTPCWHLCSVFHAQATGKILTNFHDSVDMFVLHWYGPRSEVSVCVAMYIDIPRPSSDSKGFINELNKIKVMIRSFITTTLENNYFCLLYRGNQTRVIN